MNALIKTCKASLYPILIGMGIALFSLTPTGVGLEEEFGLAWLFKLRGEVPPPEQVIIVSIDKISAQILKLPDDPEKWPRSYYAQLIEKINLQKPSIIAFNLIFSESRDRNNDQLFTQAMTKGRNTILSNYLKRSTIQNFGIAKNFKFERVIDPLPIFEQAAIGTAPFPLPKTASTVKQFWTYKNSAGDIATFPVAVFQCFVFKQVYMELVGLLQKLEPIVDFKFPATFEQLVDNYDVFDTIQSIQTALSTDPPTLEQFAKLIDAANLSAQKKRLLNSWLALLKTSDSLYFNHYGAAGAITTVPFYQVLVSDILNPDLFNNKIVLVGYSEDIEPEKNQGLYTVFSNSNSEISSPIEIAATAVANLIDNSWIKPLQPLTQFILLFAWAILLIGVCRRFSYVPAISMTLGLNLAYLVIAYVEFTTAFVWLPLFIPLLLLTPWLIVVKSVAYFFEGKQNHQKMQQAFSLYLPDNVVNSIASDQDINSMSLYGELMQGVCMATDAGQYTTLSENMNPQNLNVLMNNYYGVMFPQVKMHKGMISDVIGDAMLAIWATETAAEKHARANACQAALDISQAIDDFNQSQPSPLPTRLGLHFGAMRLGNVGAAHHYEYRAVGDTVNTATRIEGLNKLLGTRILVSAEVIKDLPGFFSRELGLFILKGKTRPIRIYELIATTTDRPIPLETPPVAEFSRALALFQQQQWSKALEIWLNSERTHPGDGPTIFYIHYLQKNFPVLSERHDDSQPTVIKTDDISADFVLPDVMKLH